MKEIKEFLLPEHTNQLYHEEAISSISLTKAVADKINELVGAYNTAFSDNLTKQQEQDGKIRKAVVYMKDNLLNSMNDLMVTLRDSGFIDDRIEFHYTKIKSFVELLETRLDNQLGTLTEDSELIDLRVGADAVTYASAGESIRTNLLKLFEILDFTNSVEWSSHPNPKIIVTSHRMRFIPISRVNLLNKSYSYIIEGYEEDGAHIFTSYTFNESMLMKDAILSDRVKYIELKLLRNDNADITVNEKGAISSYLLYPMSNALDKTLTKSSVAPDSKIVGDAIAESYSNLLSHTTKDFVTWVKALEYRYESSYLIFNKKSKFEMLSPNYLYAVKGYASDLKFIYDSGWITPMGVKSLFDYVRSERIKYVKFLIQTVDGSPIDTYSALVLHDIFEPLILPIEEKEGETVNLSTMFENIKIVNHRGYNFEAPENTFPAFKLSVEKGYKYIETDISFTKDNIPVLLHDETIDRTSNGTGRVDSYTYAELLNFDFGKWFNVKYEWTKIPTLEEFLKWSKYVGVHPYLELKYGGTTEENVRNVVSLVKKYGMIDKCTFVSAEYTFLSIVREMSPSARLGLTCQAMTNAVLNNAIALKTDKNEVFVDVNTYDLTDKNADDCMNNNIGLEMWVVNGPSALPLIRPYVTGITTDNYDLKTVLYDSVN